MENKSIKNTERLVEVKAGKTGYGLLIESDGYVSGDLTENNKKIVREAFESKENGEWYVPKPFIMDVVLQKFGIENANKRIYPEDILKREVEKYQKLIKERRALGECNHPPQAEIDLGRISHNIVECHWEGNTLVGKIEFNITEGFRKYGICSSLGDTCANLVLNGYKIGVSSRGIGSVKTVMGKTIVSSDYELLCFDQVFEPSTSGAFIGDREEIEQYIESKEVGCGNSNLNEKIEKVKGLLT